MPAGEVTKPLIPVHAFEAISRYGRYLHGEAIAIGQVAAARLSRQQSGLSAAEAQRIQVLLERAGLPTAASAKGQEIERLLAAMRLDNGFGNA